MLAMDVNGGKSEKYLDILGLTKTFKIYSAPHQERICGILYDMMDNDHLDIEHELYLEAKFIELLSLSSPAEKDNNINSDKSYFDKNNRVNYAIRYVSENFRNHNLCLDDIAVAVNTNQKYLQRIFKEAMGISIYQYISKLRMDAAVTLLISSNYNINEISEYVGYNDRRTFSEIFKKHFGMSPTEYIKSKSFER